MGPVRGSRRRKRAEKSAAAAGGQGSGDWWVDFSARIAGALFLLPPLLVLGWLSFDFSCSHQFQRSCGRGDEQVSLFKVDEYRLF